MPVRTAAESDSVAPALFPAPSADTPEDVAGNLKILQQAGLSAPAGCQLRLDMTRMVARHCAATAWLLSEICEARDLLAAFSPAAIDEVGAAPVVIARRAEEAMLAEGADGEALVSGRWPCVGGGGHAAWILLLDVTGPAGPEAVLIRREEAVLAPYDQPGALRGVGWGDVELASVPVPEHRRIAASALAGRGMGINRLVGVALGCAEAGLADYITATRARITGIGGLAVVRFAQVQARLAESDAEMASASGLFEAMKRQIAAGSVTAPARLARDRAWLARTALDAVTRLVRQMGAMGLAETNPVQRRYRDLRAIVADPAFAWDDGMARFGRQLLGVPEMEMQAAS